jgi:hypothetical protein
MHAGRQHVPVVAIAGDELITLLRPHLQTDDHGLLADIEMAEPADQAHAVELPSLLLEAPDQEHVPIGAEFLVLGEFGDLRRLCPAAGSDPLGPYLQVLAAPPGGGSGLRHRFLH